MQLANKTVVVTGVSSGIGGELARLARFQGAKVIGIDRNDTFMSLDGFIKADLGNTAAIDEAARQLPEKIDALFNIAGVPGTAPGEVVAKVNYLGLRYLTEKALPHIQAGGCIINVASVLGAEWQQRLELHKQLATQQSFADGEAWLAAHPVPYETCYQYFKEALIVWSLTKAQEYFLKHGVRMNSVAPGPVFTPILGDFVQMLGEERVQKDAPRIKRPGFADEIAAAMLFLATDAARWINGVNLPIDGGLASTYV